MRVSKYLSKHLRHQPEQLGLSLVPGGWVSVADLLAACARSGFPVSAGELAEVVRTNSKQRFSHMHNGFAELIPQVAFPISSSL
jgi:putative RNA 2'-phosphotransferase